MEGDANKYWELMQDKFEEEKSFWWGLQKFKLRRTTHWFKGDTIWLQHENNPKNKIKVLSIGDHYTYDLETKQEYRITSRNFTGGNNVDLIMNLITRISLKITNKTEREKQIDNFIQQNKNNNNNNQIINLFQREFDKIVYNSNFRDKMAESGKTMIIRKKIDNNDQNKIKYDIYLVDKNNPQLPNDFTLNDKPTELNIYSHPNNHYKSFYFLPQLYNNKSLLPFQKEQIFIIPNNECVLPTEITRPNDSTVDNNAKNIANLTSQILKKDKNNKIKNVNFNGASYGNYLNINIAYNLKFPDKNINTYLNKRHINLQLNSLGKIEFELLDKIVIYNEDRFKRQLKSLANEDNVTISYIQTMEGIVHSNNVSKRIIQEINDGIKDNSKKIKNNYGVLYGQNGNIYKGNWKNGKRDGIGVLYGQNGNIYKGNWKNGKPDGIGICHTNKGEVEIQFYNNGKKITNIDLDWQEEGKYKFVDGELKSIAKDDKYTGQVIIVNEDKSYTLQNWNKGKPYGKSYIIKDDKLIDVQDTLQRANSQIINNYNNIYNNLLQANNYDKLLQKNNESLNKTYDNLRNINGYGFDSKEQSLTTIKK